MDSAIYNSFFGLDQLYFRYRWLNAASINDYQLFTVFWNLVLVLVPAGLYCLLNRYSTKIGLMSVKQKIAAAVLFFLWLLFFPNTAYIMTDIRHLLNYCPADSPFKVCRENGWMIMFFFAYSSLGWVSFYYLLKQMAGLIDRVYNKFFSRIFVVLLMPLVSLGVLLGLLNRFNSLDAIIFPIQFIKALPPYFIDPSYLFNWLIFTGFLYLLYLGGDVIFRKV